MKAVISGYHSFIGTHLKTRLSLSDIEVVAIPRYTLHDRDSLKLFFKKEQPDYIFHLSSYGNMYDQDNEDLIVSTNIGGTYNLLQASKDINYKSFINFSSSSALLPYETLYSATKAASERLCRAFSFKYDKPITSIRPSTVIGVGEQASHLIPKLLDSCYKGTQMPFTNDPTHDFIDVRDLVEAVVLIALSDDLLEDVYNVSTNTSSNNGKVKKLVEYFTGKKANVVVSKSLRPYDTTNWKVDNTPLLELGFTPDYVLEDSIREMVAHYEKHNT